MPQGTTELQQLLRDAAARLAAEQNGHGHGHGPAPAPAPTATARVAAPPAPAPTPTPAAAPAPPVTPWQPPSWQAPAPPVPPAPPTPPAPPFAPQPAPVPYTLPFSSPEPRRSKAVVIGAIVAGLVVAGGGAGVLVATLGGAPSKAEYIKKADAACVTSNAPVASIAKPTSYPELVTASSVVVTNARGQVATLQKLERPGGAAGTAARDFVTALDSTAVAAQKLQDAATAKDDAATIAGTHALGAAFNDTKAKAAAYGLTACGTGMVTGIDSLYAGSSGVVKTAYIAKADSLCRQASKDMDKVAEPRNDSGRELARYLNGLFAIFDQMTADIKALPVAPGDEATVAAIMAAQDEVNVKSRDLSAAAQVEDESRFFAADKVLTPLITAADAKWDAYGLSVCGSNFGAE